MKMYPALIGFVLLAGVSCHSEYRALFPNGYSVPSPCGGIWEAVGHYDPHHHTHDKNPYGLAFSGNGHVWNPTLCNLDSDGDGKTNGEELGDPTCIWTPGSTPTGSATGHPGFCEPVGSAQCSHDAFSCNCHGHNCVGK